MTIGMESVAYLAGGPGWRLIMQCANCVLLFGNMCGSLSVLKVIVIVIVMVISMIVIVMVILMIVIVMVISMMVMVIVMLSMMIIIILI